MKEKVYELEFYGKKHRIVLAKTSYSNNDSIAVIMLEQTEDGEEEWGVLTINLDGQCIPADSTSAYIDTNNLGNDILKWLKKNKIATVSPFLGFSGYCSYPYVMFTKQALDAMRALQKGGATMSRIMCTDGISRTKHQYEMWLTNLQELAENEPGDLTEEEIEALQLEWLWY